MDADPGADLGGLGWFAVSLVVMMAAMMLPALAPMLVAYERRASHADSVATFAAGYFAAWLAAGLLAYAVINWVRSLGGRGRVGGRRLAHGVADWPGFLPPPTSNRACDFPAHGSPTFFTGGIQRPGRHGRLGRGATMVPLRLISPRRSGDW